MELLQLSQFIILVLILLISLGGAVSYIRTQSTKTKQTIVDYATGSIVLLAIAGVAVAATNIVKNEQLQDQIKENVVAGTAPVDALFYKPDEVNPIFMIASFVLLLFVSVVVNYMVAPNRVDALLSRFREGFQQTA